MTISSSHGIEEMKPAGKQPWKKSFPNIRTLKIVGQRTWPFPIQNTWNLQVHGVLHEGLAVACEIGWSRHYEYESAPSFLDTRTSTYPNHTFSAEK